LSGGNPATTFREKVFEGYIKQTVEQHSLLLITLKNRKVYIGAVLKDSNLQFKELDAEEEKYIKVIVALSGYRSDADMKMHLTTDYTDEELEICMRDAGMSNFDLEILISVKEIASIQPFNPKVYREHFMHSRGVGWATSPRHDATDSPS